MRNIAVLAMALTAIGLAGPAQAGTRITQGKALVVQFDITPTGFQAADDPNLVLLDFASPITLSSNAVATATLVVDGVELGTATVTSCPVCASAAWEFASAALPQVSAFPHPTIVDFAPLLAGTTGAIVLRVQSGYVDFGAPSNGPQVEFRAVVSCGSDCTGFNVTTIEPTNTSFAVTASRKTGSR
jgi:hypothetical protein